MERGRYRTRRHREMLTAWIREDDIELLRQLKGPESFGWAVEKLLEHFRNCNPSLRLESTLRDK
jgi:hypothetical protein